jgi:spermidine synthase
MAFVELASEDTPMGEVSLRRRRDLTLDVDVYEVKLGDEFLMSSLFTVAERALADLGLAMLDAPGPLHVLVGGLGLGYTAGNVLRDDRVGACVVVDALGEVIDWHRRELLPLSAALVGDDRCSLVHGDFFAMTWPLGPYDAVLVDIDHTPTHVLHPSHAAFYSPDGLQLVANRLRAGGVFGLWSDDPPDEDFLGVLREVFDDVRGDVVEFANPLTGGTSANSVYLGRRR